MGPLTRALILFLAGAPAHACQYPDEGNMPLRRAVAAVRYLPEIEAWAKQAHEAGKVVQYAVLLDRPLRENGRCYWPVEVWAGQALFRRYFITPAGAFRN